MNNGINEDTFSEKLSTASTISNKVPEGSNYSEKISVDVVDVRKKQMVVLNLMIPYQKWVFYFICLTNQI